MKIETPVIVSKSGTLRIPVKKPTPRKDELLINLTLDIPDSAFAPPALSMRAVMSSALNGATTVASPMAERAPAKAVRDDGRAWTGERIRRVQALLDIEREELARRLGVTLRVLRDWESGASEVGLEYRDRLAALELQAVPV